MDNSGATLIGHMPLDAIVTLLVVLVGVPALVLQSLAPEVRRAVTKRWARLLFEVGLPMALAILVISVEIVGWTAWGWNSDWHWMVVIGFVLLMAVITAVHVPNAYGRRDVIINNLGYEAARSLSNEARLVENAVQDLIELGEQSAPGQDKEWVLQALQNLTDQTCEHPAYRGDGLETLIRGLGDILTSGLQPWSPQNFRTAADILKRIVIAFDAAESSGFLDVDLLYAVRELSALGRLALMMENDYTPMNFIEALGSTSHRHPKTGTAVSQALFEVGVAAIEKGQMFVAVAASDKLSTLFTTFAPAQGELAADMLGMLAHFWTAGETAQGYATRRMIELTTYLARELPAALKSAQEHYAQRTRFQTADKLYQMLQELSTYPFNPLWSYPVSSSSSSACRSQ